MCSRVHPHAMVTFSLVPFVPFGLAFEVQHAWAICAHTHTDVKVMVCSGRDAGMQQAAKNAVKQRQKPQQISGIQQLGLFYSRQFFSTNTRAFCVHMYKNLLHAYISTYLHIYIYILSEPAGIQFFQQLLNQ